MFTNDRTNQPVIILSAERANLADDKNHARHIRLKRILANMDMAHKDCIGFFEGSNERSVAVPIPHWGERLNVRAVFALAFDTFGQDSVLWLSPRDAKGRHVFLIDNETGRRMIHQDDAYKRNHGEHLGYWRRVLRTDAEEHDAYTVDLTDPAHGYVVK